MRSTVKFNYDYTSSTTHKFTRRFSILVDVSLANSCTAGAIPKPAVPVHQRPAHVDVIHRVTVGLNDVVALRSDQSLEIHVVQRHGTGLLANSTGVPVDVRMTSFLFDFHPIRLGAEKWDYRVLLCTLIADVTIAVVQIRTTFLPHQLTVCYTSRYADVQIIIGQFADTLLRIYNVKITIGYEYIIKYNVHAKLPVPVLQTVSFMKLHTLTS